MSAQPARSARSITVYILAVILALLLPVVILAGYINHQFMQEGIRRVGQTHTQLLESYMAQIDRELDMAETYMNGLIFNNGTTAGLHDRDTASFYYSANLINDDISKTLLHYQYISGFFLYVPESHLRYIHTAGSDLSGQSELRDYLCDTFSQAAETDSDWHFAEVGGVRYLVQGYCGAGITGGAFLNLDKLPDQRDHASNGVTFCSGEQLQEAAGTQPRGSTLISAASSKSGLHLYEVLGEEDTLAELPFLQRYILLVTVFVALTLPLVFLALRQLIIQPLQRLSAVMRDLENGDLDVRIRENEHGREFQQIDHTFNSMTAQIKDLKIAVYEEQLETQKAQLETQKAQLQNLSYQLRPHFMVNSLTMAHNMITAGDLAGAQQLMSFSIRYLRYMLTQEGDFVPLQDELDHIQNYMGIQQLRYAGKLRCEVQADPFLKGIQVPSMILQNFVENSVKYSVSPDGDKLTVVQLIVSYCERDGVPSASIIVRDNGAGYPDWLLQALERRDPEALRDRVGLRNTLQRIQMLYGDQAVCRFYNDAGAVYQLIIPLGEDDGLDEDDPEDEDGF